MSLLSTFLASHLIPALEAALAAHEPEIQAGILAELEALGGQVGAWVESKIKTATPVQGA
ncbi:MAG: hypothetical protein KGI25_04515 [Thaumarchaeota archaeon]|nr:hypothetical protein [Nitrososphaerota archaeon]